MKLSSLVGSAILASMLIGCGTDEGACCESNIATTQKQVEISAKTPETKIVVDTYLDDSNLQDNGSKNSEPKKPATPVEDDNKPIQEFTNLPPVAVIDVSNCGSSYTISCKDSYDADEDGNGIKQCNWDIVSYDENGCPHKEYQKSDKDDTQDAFIAPCEHVKYIEVKLTVIDNEGSHDCVTQKIELP